MSQNRTTRSANTRRCPICGENRPAGSLARRTSIRPAVRELVERDHPEWIDDMEICETDLHRYRLRHVEELVIQERQNVSSLDREVLTRMAQDDLVVQNINDELAKNTSFGERVADRIAGFGGSWTFIILFTSVIVGWIALNSVQLAAGSFDPFPFILLNLVLSCVAAMQAPVIMMSQNRQDEKDRLRAEHDYRVNLKAELEIQILHEKLDHLVLGQWSALLDVQATQAELLDELAAHIKKPR